MTIAKAIALFTRHVRTVAHSGCLIFAIGCIPLSAGCFYSPLFTALQLLSVVDESLNIPPDAEVGVQFNEAGLAKSIAVDNSEFGIVTDALVGNFDTADGDEIMIVSRSGSFVFDARFTLQSSLEFSPPFVDGLVIAVDAESDGVLEYLSTDYADVALYDSEGQLLWINPDGGRKLADYADTDGDGFLEFLQFTDDGFWILDHEGAVEMGITDDHLCGMQFADVDDDGIRELAFARSNTGCSHYMLGEPGSGLELVIVDSVHEEVFEDPCLECAVGFSEIFRFPDRDGEYHSVNYEGDAQWEWFGSLPEGIYNVTGENVREMDVLNPLCWDTYSDDMVTGPLLVNEVRFRDSDEPYLAFLYASYCFLTYNVTSPHMRLSIFDPEGTEVYREILDDPNGVLTTVPSQDGQSEDLLVITDSHIYRYEL